MDEKEGRSSYKGIIMKLITSPPEEKCPECKQAMVKVNHSSVLAHVCPDQHIIQYPHTFIYDVIISKNRILKVDLRHSLTLLLDVTMPKNRNYFEATFRVVKEWKEAVEYPKLDMKKYLGE
jgi:hypothetical protein